MCSDCRARYHRRYDEPIDLRHQLVERCKSVKSKYANRVVPIAKVLRRKAQRCGHMTGEFEFVNAPDGFLPYVHNPDNWICSAFISMLANDKPGGDLESFLQCCQVEPASHRFEQTGVDDIFDLGGPTVKDLKVLYLAMQQEYIPFGICNFENIITVVSRIIGVELDADEAEDMSLYHEKGFLFENLDLAANKITVFIRACAIAKKNQRSFFERLFARKYLPLNDNVMSEVVSYLSC